MLIDPQGPPWWIFFHFFFKNVLVYPQLTQKYVLWHSKLEKSILGRRELIKYREKGWTNKIIILLTRSDAIIPNPFSLIWSCIHLWFLDWNLPCWNIMTIDFNISKIYWVNCKTQSSDIFTVLFFLLSCMEVVFQEFLQNKSENIIINLETSHTSSTVQLSIIPRVDSFFEGIYSLNSKLHFTPPQHTVWLNYDFYLTEIYFLMQTIFLVFYLSEKYKNGTIRTREKIFKKKQI